MIRVASDIVMVRRLAAGDQNAQSIERRLLADAQPRGRVEGYRHAKGFVLFLQGPRVVAQSSRHRHEGHAMQKRGSQFPKGRVEAGSRNQGKAILGPEADCFPSHQGGVDQTVVLDQNAFGHPRRS